MKDLLSYVFPVTLPSVVLEFESPKALPHDPFATPVTECGIGIPQPKRYRDAVERVQVEGL
jgi:hypothetical protein